MVCLCVIAEALAGQVSKENYEKGMIYPSFSSIRKISAHIAASVATKAYELGLSLSTLFLSHLALICGQVFMRLWLKCWFCRIGGTASTA